MFRDQLAFIQDIGPVPCFFALSLCVICVLFRSYQGVRYILLTFFLVWIAPFVMDRNGLLLAFSVPAVFAVGLLIWAASYSKRFPVFVGSPLETIYEDNGYEHHLYLREWKSSFIIGVDYEWEADGSVSRRRTRWTDRFPNRETAENQLRRRFTEWLGSGCMRGTIE